MFIMKSNNLLLLDRFESLAQITKALGHPLRLHIILLLDQKGEVSVKQICSLLHREQTIVSQHLSKMKLMKFLSARREGKFMLYAIRHEGLAHMIQLLLKSDIKLQTQ